MFSSSELVTKGLGLGYKRQHQGRAMLLGSCTWIQKELPNQGWKGLPFRDLQTFYFTAVDTGAQNLVFAVLGTRTDMS